MRFISNYQLFQLLVGRHECVCFNMPTRENRDSRLAQYFFINVSLKTGLN